MNKITGRKENNFWPKDDNGVKKYATKEVLLN